MSTTKSSVDLEASRGPQRSLSRLVAPKSSLRRTATLAAMSLGIIYGDVGTSALYVMNAIFPSSGPAPSKEDTIGAVSA